MKKRVSLFFVHLLFFVAIAHGDPVRIAYLQSDIHQLPCWVAMERGFFEKEAVKVEVAERLQKHGVVFRRIGTGELYSIALENLSHPSY